MASRLARQHLVLALFVPVVGWGASQGQLGSESRGSLSISFIVGETVQISGLTDVELRAESDQPATGLTDACINVSSGAPYSISVTGTGPQQALHLTSATDSLPYTVALEDGAGTTELAQGGSISRAGTTEPAAWGCPRGPNTRILVSSPLPATSLQNEIYSGALTLMITTE